MSVTVHPLVDCDPDGVPGTCNNVDYHDIQIDEGCNTSLCPGWQPSDEDEDEGRDTHLCNGQQPSVEDEA